MSTVGRKIISALKAFNRDLKSGSNKLYTVHVWREDDNGELVRTTERVPLRKWLEKRTGGRSN